MDMSARSENYENEDFQILEVTKVLLQNDADRAFALPNVWN